MHTFEHGDKDTTDMSPIDRILYDHRMKSIGLTWVLLSGCNGWEVTGKIQGKKVAYTNLTKFPGSSTIWAPITAWVQPEYRCKGIGRAMMRVKLDVAKYFGAELLIATVRHDNTTENRILILTGWRVVQSLEDVAIWTREL